MIGIRVSAAYAKSQLQISNIWQASHVATGKCISCLTALPVASESQLQVGRRMAAAAPVGVFIFDIY